MLFIALTPLIIFFFILIPVAFLDISGVNDIKKEMNELYSCNYCGLVHRKYQRMLFQKETECPHCHEGIRNFKKFYSSDKEAKFKYPFALKLSLIGAVRIHRAIKNKDEKEFIDNQLEKYIKVQEEQLEKIRIKKDEMIKNGTFSG